MARNAYFRSYAHSPSATVLARIRHPPRVDILGTAEHVKANTNPICYHHASKSTHQRHDPAAAAATEMGQRNMDAQRDTLAAIARVLERSVGACDSGYANNDHAWRRNGMEDSSWYLCHWWVAVGALDVVYAVFASSTTTTTTNNNVNGNHQEDAAAASFGGRCDA